MLCLRGSPHVFQTFCSLRCSTKELRRGKEESSREASYEERTSSHAARPLSFRSPFRVATQLTELLEEARYGGGASNEIEASKKMYPASSLVSSTLIKASVTPRWVSFRDLIQMFRRASPTFSHESPGLGVVHSS